MILAYETHEMNSMAETPPDNTEPEGSRTDPGWMNFGSSVGGGTFEWLVEEAKTTETKEKRITKTVELAANNLPPYDEEKRRI